MKEIPVSFLPNDINKLIDAYWYGLIRLSKTFYYLVIDKHLHGLTTGLVSVDPLMGEGFWKNAS